MEKIKDQTLAKCIREECAKPRCKNALLSQMEKITWLARSANGWSIKVAKPNMTTFLTIIATLYTRRSQGSRWTTWTQVGQEFGVEEADVWKSAVRYLAVNRTIVCDTDKGVRLNNRELDEGKINNASS